MKFDLGETWGEYEKRVRNWHRWFAWYPVRISMHDYRWLETVERSIRWSSSYADYEWQTFYRALKK